MNSYQRSIGWCLLLVAGWASSCQKLPKLTADAGGDGAAARLAAPLPEGPFVEPPVGENPKELFCVLIGRTDSLAEAEALVNKALRVPLVPVGYPAVDQAGGFFSGGKGFVVLAGKFSRKDFAQVMAESLRKAGLEQSAVVERSYRHDRLTPALNDSEGLKAGLVFSGVAGVDVPLFSAPAREAPAGTRLLADGSLALVTRRQEIGGEFWNQVGEGDGVGFLPGSRLLVEYNVFPSANGRQAILGVPLGCAAGSCRWDYWLVGHGFSPRQLLAPAAASLPHSFSNDGAWLAYSTPEGHLVVVSTATNVVTDLGIGTGPFFAEGDLLTYRKPGRGGSRDEVFAASAPLWQPHQVLDYPGEPTYPQQLSLVPPALVPHGRNLIAKFYRQIQTDGGTEIQLVTVLVTPEGKILDKRVEPLTE